MLVNGSFKDNDSLGNLEEVEEEEWAKGKRG